MTAKCIACNGLLEDGSAWARVEFHGFTTLRLNGVDLYVHARCFRLAMPDAEPLPSRVSETVVEPGFVVTIVWGELGWTAECAEHGTVAVKSIVGDAEMGAARHLLRAHT